MVHSKRKKSSVSKKQAEKFSNEVPTDVEKTEVVLGKQFNVDPNLFDEVEDYAILILDTKGNIISWNKGAEKIKGYQAKEIIGKNYRMFYTKEDKDSNLSEKLLDQARRNGRVSEDGWRVRKDGTRFWGSMTLTTLHKENGEIRGYLKITRDLSEKKVAEDSQSNFLEELKAKNRELKKSEERYHKMVSEVIDYAIILLDRDGTVLDWNKGAEKLKGYSKKEIVGKHFRLFYPKEEKEGGLPERLLTEAEKKGSVVHEGWRIKKDGKRFWGNIVITTLHSDEGEIIGFSKVTRDLTDRKIAEDKLSIVMEELRQANDTLKQSEERYHRMIEEVQDYAIIMLDTNGRIQNWNAGAEAIKGYQVNEVIGKNFTIFYRKEDQADNLPEKLLEEARRVGKVSHEGWRVRKDKTHFWGSVVITALHSAEGEIIGFSKVTRDLTEKKNAEDTLKLNAAQIDLKNKMLERLNDELSSFTYVASHDLKEPLRKIQTFASRIEDQGFNEEKSKEYLDKIKTSAIRMQSLIENLLSYSQVSNDSSAIEKVDLNETLKTVKADLEILIGEKQAVITSNKLPVVSGVGYQFQQLFLNLLSNSIKFSRPGELPKIDIRSRIIKGPEIPGETVQGNNRYYHISIRDNGIGFPAQYAAKIFEAFQRLNPKNTFAGSGVGLAIVKKIVENHHGIVSAESKQGVGSIFHFYLPI